MIPRVVMGSGRRLALALAIALTAPGSAWARAGASCLALLPADGGAPLAVVALPGPQYAFRVTYVHSVTLTPVDERYVVTGDRIVQTQIRFVQHGPGLPTAPDAGGTFEERDGAFVVTGQREFDRIVMRVDAAQRPVLSTSAAALDLARWGRRAVAITPNGRGCDAAQASGSDVGPRVAERATRM